MLSQDFFPQAVDAGKTQLKLFHGCLDSVFQSKFRDFGPYFLIAGILPVLFDLFVFFGDIFVDATSPESRLTALIPLPARPS